MKPIVPTLLILLLLSCKKEEGPYQPVQLCSELTHNWDTIQKYLPGRWEWVEDRMVTREGYVYYTPKTQGYQDYLSLPGDTIIFTRTGKPALVRRFNVVPEKEVTLWPEDEHPVLVTYDSYTGDYASYYHIDICKDQLILGMNYRGEVPDKIYRRKP